MLSDEDMKSYREFLSELEKCGRSVTLDFSDGKWIVSSWGNLGLVETYGKKRQSLKKVIYNHKSDLVVSRIGGENG